MATGLDIAKVKLEKDINKALKNAMSSLFLDDTPMNDAIASTFADSASQTIADAVYDFIKNAMITGTINGVVTGTCATGPVAGTNIDVLSGTELTIL